MTGAVQAGSGVRIRGFEKRLGGSKTENTYLRGALAASLGHVFWGFSYLFIDVALRYANPNVMLAIRYIITFLLMNLLVLTGRAKISLKGKNVKPLLLLGVIEPAYFYFESYGILYTNTTFAGVILAMVPVVSIGMSVMFLHEFPTRRQLIFCILPIAGVILMTISGHSLGIVTPLGMLLLAGCCLTSAGYKVVNRGTAAEFSPFERAYFVFLFSMVIFTVTALVSVHGSLAAFTKPLGHTPFVVSILILSVTCSVISNLLVNYAAGRLPVVAMASFSSITTLVSMFAGIVFLKEPVSAAILIGAALIVIGIRQVTRQN